MKRGRTNCWRVGTFPAVLTTCGADREPWRVRF